MDESRSWRRGFAAGFLALALSVGGHVATGVPASDTGVSCPLTRARLARFRTRAAAEAETQGLAQRVARAVLGAVLHGGC